MPISRSTPSTPKARSRSTTLARGLLVTGKLAVDRLDLTPYLSPETTSTARPVAPGDSAPAPSSAAQSDGNDLAIDASPLELADLDVDLNIGSIAYRKFQIETSTAAIRVKDDRLTADLSRMALYRGSGRGTVTVDGSGAAPSVGINIALAQVQIDPLAQALIGDSRLTGTGNLDIAVTARGRSQRELINTLSGRAALSLANGQIKGVNLPALAASAAKIERDIIRTLDIYGHAQPSRPRPDQQGRSAGARRERSQEPRRRRQQQQFRHPDGNRHIHQWAGAQQ